jgi:hypothetical protein
MSSLTAAIRGAMLADDEENLPEPGATGATAPLTMKGNLDMSGEQKPAAGISQADHDSAIASATSAGHAAGVTAATVRLSAALGAEGVKGDAGRMSAALDLAVKSPGMSGPDVAAFVVANVPAAKPAAEVDAAGYDAARVAAAGQAQPQGGKKPQGAAMNWADFRAKRGKKV